MEDVRVRFAPSPTGALHIGGLRTALFNYLFAKQHNGVFVLRIEDTDQARFVEGAEEYIQEALKWCGIEPDESPNKPGPFGPYRQSERKSLYKEYADQLIASGNAYYAFDTPEELDEMREKLMKARVIKPQYNTVTRKTMKNSLTFSDGETKKRLDGGEPYVIRIKVPEGEEVRLKDQVRGWVKVKSEDIDDKVLMKSDGMPTYHLANVVDDHLMKITHVIRGEEWLPSAPLHVLLYQFLGWEDTIPSFAHLPLILKPDGNGKLSKRAADKAGFPIFPLDWKDHETGELSLGFKESGFLPEALLNFLAFLGWNPGTEQEIFSLKELVDSFSIERVNKAGTKFDFEKVKWYNQQYIKTAPTEVFARQLIQDLDENHDIKCSIEKSQKIIKWLKGRVTFPNEFAESSLILFQNPDNYDESVKSKKWSSETSEALRSFSDELETHETISADAAKELFWKFIEGLGHKPGQFMQPLRLALTGQGSGPDLMSIIEIMGGIAASKRINTSATLLDN